MTQLCLVCGSTENYQTLCLGARPRYNLIVDEDVKKPNKQTNLLLSPARHPFPLYPTLLYSLSACYYPQRGIPYLYTPPCCILCLLVIIPSEASLPSIPHPVVFSVFLLLSPARHPFPLHPTLVYSLSTCYYPQRGIILHELGHAIGFWHEQSRPDRDDHVTFVEDNVNWLERFNFRIVSSFGVYRQTDRQIDR